MMLALWYPFRAAPHSGCGGEGAATLQQLEPPLALPAVAPPPLRHRPAARPAQLAPQLDPPPDLRSSPRRPTCVARSAPAEVPKYANPGSKEGKSSPYLPKYVKPGSKVVAGRPYLPKYAKPAVKNALQGSYLPKYANPGVMPPLDLQLVSPLGSRPCRRSTCRSSTRNSPRRSLRAGGSPKICKTGQ